MMRVFAEFFIGDDGKEYRRKTLLHFGTSVELIGSAVLMNPGGAKVIGDPDNEFLKRFYSHCGEADDHGRPGHGHGRPRHESGGSQLRQAGLLQRRGQRHYDL